MVVASVFGADLLNFLKSAQGFGLFGDKTQLFVHGLDLAKVGTLKDVLPENTLATVWYPFYALSSAKSKSFEQEVARRMNTYATGSAPVGYVAGRMITEAIKRAGGPDDVDRVVKALANVEFEGPTGAVKVRSCDNMAMYDFYVGTVRRDPKLPDGIGVVDVKTYHTERVARSCEDIAKARACRLLSGRARSMALLDVDGLEAGYGGSRVLFGISLSVERGEVVALLGRNGAGKTTTLSSIMGLVTPRGGSVRLAGREIGGREPFEACRSGLGFVAEDCRLFRGLTVAENFEAARRPPRDGLAPWDVARVVAMFPQVGPLHAPAGRRAQRGRAAHGGGGPNAHGQSRAAPARRAVGGAGAARRPDACSASCRRSSSTGATVLISEQNLRFATELADRVYIIEKGEIRYHGTPAELALHPDVRQQYLMV